MTSTDKTKFRSRKLWKDFRLKLITKANFSCELCGTKYAGKRKKMLQVHHLDPANYENLIDENFKCLCSSCHDTVERMAVKLLGKNRLNIPNLESWLVLYEEYLPVSAVSMAHKILNKTGD